MKYFTIIISLFLSIQWTQAQNTTNIVILESSTGTWCPSCPAVSNIFKDMTSDGLSVGLIKYHGSDSFEIPASAARNNYYEVQWYPQAFVGGFGVGYDDWANPSKFIQMYEEEIDTPSDFTIDYELIKSNENTYKIIGTVVSEAGVNLQSVKLHIVLTENNYQHSWQGQSELNNICRMMIPDHNGTEVNQNEQAFEFEFTRDAEWSEENMEVILFVQKDTDRDILQGKKSLLSDASPSSTAGASRDLQVETYPNPATELINIKGENLVSLSLTTINGEILLTQKLDKNNHQHQISILPTNITSGMYLLNLVAEDGSKASQKIKIVK